MGTTCFNDQKKRKHTHEKKPKTIVPDKTTTPETQPEAPNKTTTPEIQPKAPNKTTTPETQPEAPNKTTTPETQPEAPNKTTMPETQPEAPNKITTPEIQPEAPNKITTPETQNDISKSMGTEEEIHNLGLSDVEKFVNDIIIQDTFFENKIDKKGKSTIYIELKKYEKNKLRDEFITNNNDCLTILKSNKINFIVEQRLISNIIVNENVEKVLMHKIKNELEKMKEIKDNNSNLNIDHLNILLVGRRGVGKKQLIKYILKINNDYDIKKGNSSDFKEYESENVEEIKLIKYRGIGYAENNDPDVIKDKTDKFIKARAESENPNDFIHCIWYCIADEKIEDIEIEYLLKLKKVYASDCIPIIMVYLQGTIPEEMKAHILKKLSDTPIINVIAKRIIKKNGKSIEPNGYNDLCDETIKKIKESIKGAMQKLMTQSYRNYIKNRIQEENEEIKKRIMNLNIKNFVEDYKTVLNDHDFINYIINLIGRNLKLFFNDNNISNRSLNFIINSSIMKSIINFINDHKKNLKKLIVDIINKNSIDFINKQADLEKFHKSNIETKNKRSLEGFKKTSKIFLKKIFIIHAKNIS